VLCQKKPGEMRDFDHSHPFHGNLMFSTNPHRSGLGGLALGGLSFFDTFFADNFQHIHFCFISTSMVRSSLQAFCVFISSKLQIQVSHLCHCRVMLCRHQSRALAANRKGNCFVPQVF